MFFLIIFTLFQVTFSYTPTTIPNKNYKVLYPPSKSNRTSIFLPDQFSNILLPSSFYSNLLNNMLDLNFKTYSPYSPNDSPSLLNDLKNENISDITLIAHSNSASHAVCLANEFDNINSLILIDPLDLTKTDLSSFPLPIPSFPKFPSFPTFFNKKKQLNVNKLILVNSLQDDKWSFFPFVPPISIFNFNISEYDLSSVQFDEFEFPTYDRLDIFDNYPTFLSDNQKIHETSYSNIISDTIFNSLNQ